METVKLKNGTYELKPFVIVYFNSIKMLLEKNPIAFYELTMKARNSDHQFFENAKDVLESFKLVQSDGHIHQSIVNVILSAVEGDMLDMKLVSPFA